MIKRATSLLAIAAVALVCAMAISTLGSTSAFAAKGLSRPVLKLLQEAQKDTQKSPPDWAGALAKAKEAEALPSKKPYDEFKINDFLTMIYVNTKEYANAATAYEAAYLSNEWEKDEKPTRLKTLVQLFFQSKAYDKALTYANEYSSIAPDDLDNLAIISNIYYVKNDAAKGLSTVQDLIAKANAAGTAIKEPWWRLLLVNASAAKKEDVVQSALFGLAEDYPSKAVWHDLIGHLYNMPGRTDHYGLMCFRLMMAANAMTTSEEYLSMAQLALNVGQPGEAAKVLAAGEAAGILPGDEKTLTRTLKSDASKVSKGEPGNLDAKDKQAAAGKSGGSDVAIGETLAIYAMYDKAIAAINRGIAKPTLRNPDEGRMSLGWVYFLQGKYDQAKSTFQAIKSEARLTNLARAWLALIKEKTSPPSTSGDAGSSSSP